MPDLSSFAQESFALYSAVKRSSDELLAIRERMRKGEEVEKSLKSDFWESWLSAADLRSQELAIAEMKKFYPYDIYIAEEGDTIVGDRDIPHDVLDPIDGTRHFLNIAEEDVKWSVTFARYRRNSRVGIIMRPALKDWFLGAVVGEKRRGEVQHIALRFCDKGSERLPVVLNGASRNRFRVLVCQPEKYTRIARVLEDNGCEVVSAGPCTFACIEVACGEADAYVAPGGYGAGGVAHPNQMWDWAAGWPLIEASGGQASQISGASLGLAHTSFLAWRPGRVGGPYHGDLIQMLKRFTPENNFGRDM